VLHVCYRRVTYPPRALHVLKKRPFYPQKRLTYPQKRPINPQDLYTSPKRDLFIQKITVQVIFTRAQQITRSRRPFDACECESVCV